MSWFGCTHQWYPVGVWHYRDTSYSTSGVPSTRITSRCLKCGEIHSEAHYGSGYLDLSALQSAPTKFKQPHDKDAQVLRIVK
jgi:hypothetical protein